MLGLFRVEFRVSEFWFRVRQTRVEGFGKVIDQCPETLSVPSTCRRTEWTEIWSPGSRWTGRSTEYGGRRSDGVRVREERR